MWNTDIMGASRVFVLLLAGVWLAGARAAEGWACPMQAQTPPLPLVEGGEGARHPRVWACTPGMQEAATYGYARAPNPAPGAYVLALRVKVADNTVKRPLFRVYLAEEPGAALADVTCYATDVPVAGAYTALHIPLMKTGAASALSWQFAYLGAAPLWVDEIAVLPVDARPGGPPPVEITRFRTPKLLYWSDELPSLEVTVRNHTAEAQTVTLEVTGEAGLGQEVLRAEQPLTLEPGATAFADIPWPLRGRQYGFTLRGRLLRDAAVLDTRSQIFAIADNFNMVSQYAALTPAMDLASVTNILEGYRAAYIGACEMTGWASSDFAGLAPDREQWVAGARLVEREGVRGALHAARGLGLRALAVTGLTANGPEGLAWARAHPEAIAWDGGRYDVELLDALRAGDVERARHGDGASAFVPNLADPAVQRVAADEVRRSVELFGWDGIRYTVAASPAGENLLGRAFTTAPSTAGDVGAQLARALRAALTAKYPRCVVGASPADAARKAAAEGGGMLFDEEIGRRGAGARWDEIANAMLFAARAARDDGGHQVIRIADTMATLCWAARPYPYVLTLAAGAHVAYASPAHGMSRYCAFAMRYGELLYDVKARPLLGEMNPFGVAAPVWWQGYVTVRPLPGRRLQYIISLVNPPGGARTDGVIIPPPAREKLPVTFRLPHGERLIGAWALSPEPEPHAVALTPAIGDVLTLTVPRLEYWTMVVVETAPEEVKP